MPKSNAAAIQKGIANFCRNSKGIPTTVIPIIDNKAIIPRHTLWHTLYPPKKLIMPENMLVPVDIFSLEFISIQIASHLHPVFQ